MARTVSAEKEDALRQEEKIFTWLKQAEKTFTQVALELDKFIQAKMWIPLGHQSLTEWKEAKFGTHYQFFRLRTPAKLLGAGVESEQVEEMPHTNIYNLTRLPEKFWASEKWVQDAIEMDVATFESRVEATLEKRHLKPEDMVTRGFRLPQSLADRWDFALKVAETVDGCERMEERVEALVACYLGSPSEKKGKSREQRFHELVKGAK